MHPPSTLMLKGWLTGEKVERSWVPLEQLSPHLIRAVILSEDSAFCSHWGVDFTQVQQVIQKTGGKRLPSRGASSISMQLAKNLFLWHGRSWTRKALEVPLALWLELTWSKRDILEAYLNIVEWGDGVYGAEAASRNYFSTKARGLSSQQAALLAAALPNPVVRNPAYPSFKHLYTAGSLVARIQRGQADMECVK
jgi:monofunctional glycosyltransferase